jgi:uncharacterized protein (DUF433 family)
MVAASECTITVTAEHVRIASIEIMGGRACIRGMRIPVSVIVGQIAHGATYDDVLSDYPDLEPEDLRQAIEYAAWLTQEEIHAV